MNRRKIVGIGAKKTAANEMDMDDLFEDNFGSSKDKRGGATNGVGTSGAKSEEMDTIAQPKQPKITDLFGPKAAVDKKSVPVVDITEDWDGMVQYYDQRTRPD